MKTGIVQCSGCGNNTFLITVVPDGIQTQCINCKNNELVVELPVGFYNDAVHKEEKR